MSRPVTWTADAVDGHARSGWLETGHGRVRTPAFMPVGTRAAVKTLDSGDLEAVGAEIVLANTYHLMLRPGATIVARLGGIHRMMSWGRPVLTDSGGYQILSLEPVVEEAGATFRSVYDGSVVSLTPELAVAVQEEIGADIAMALDVCPGLPAPSAVVEEAMRRTLRWAERCLRAHARPDQALFGIVQGGVDPELRLASAEETVAFGFDGFGIGGLSVGETRPERNLAMEAAMSALPDDRPRYVMGVGDTDGILEAIARGADMFDCVLPTRLARHGKALTRHGDFNLRRGDFEGDARPVDPECTCPTCARYSRGYLRHLIRAREASGQRLLTIHNLHYTLQLVSGAADAIAARRFGEYCRSVVERRSAGSPRRRPSS